ncbi:MAG: hypothetical protein JWL72_4388 [Ilumatobacteraceae bacterium]|nr:hypothetical protein [Ilumatobacteraceae bacterium]MCU1391050.1 hypothetical protein [Ilumatobacteraceae bacterium]
MTFENLPPENEPDKKFANHKSAASGSSGPSVALIALLLLIALALTFVLQNRGEVRTHFLFFAKTAKVWATIGVALVIGAGLDRLASIWWRRRKQKSTSV